MGIVSRILLLLYVLATGAATVILAAAALNLMPANYWQPSLKFILSRPETLGVLAAMFVLSLFFLTRVFVSDGNKASYSDDRLSVADDEIVLQQGQVGEVRVSVDAIQRISERAALTVNGVRESHAIVFKGHKHSPIAIKLEIVLGQGFSAPIISENTVNAVNGAILTALQLPEVPVEIKVTDITNAGVERQRRVV